MSKPLGLQLGITDAGAPFMRVTPDDHAADLVWDAVREAILAGYTVEQFRDEARQAWSETLRENAKSDDKAWTR